MRIPYSYSNNPNLPSEQYRHSFTQKELDEYTKCVDDPVYFSETYIKIINVDEGLIPFAMWPYQEDLMNTFHNNRFTICKFPRQTGKTSVAVAYLLHYILFNKDARVAILANRAPTAREILARLKLAFEYLPMFLKQGIKEWNKGSVIFANGSSVLADSTTGGSIRGLTFNIIFLDEFAFVPNNLAESFFSSTYPTITSGKTTKVIIVSTPNGLNMYYKMWMDATDGRSHYVPKEIHWSMVPGRDDAWAQETIRNTSQRQFDQEFGGEFLGSTNTLISGDKLRQLRFLTPVRSEKLGQHGSYDIYEEPQKKHTYVICVDVSEGQGLDYSAFSVFDVTQIPYRQVAKYRRNDLAPMLLPTVLYTEGKKYNDAYILVEINAIGLQVSDTLHFELAYENLLKFQMKGKQGTQNSGGFGATKTKIAFGLKTTVQTKNIGCSNLKALIESDKLIINDSDTILELSTFSSEGKTYKAEEGSNDDLAMTLVAFGWLTSQRYFKETINNNVRAVLQQEMFNIMDQDLVPFGFIDNGLEPEYELDSAGDRWVREREHISPFDSMNYDWFNREKL